MLDYDAEDILATTTSICTILQFLTGILVCLKIRRNKTTGDLSSFPFVSGCLSTSLWLRYGLLVQNDSIIHVNAVGVTLFITYVVYFLLYAKKPSTVLKQYAVCMVFLVLVLYFISNLEHLTAINYLGVVCCIVTIIFFAAPFASLLHVIRVKNSESLPFPIIMSNFIVTLLWFIYGGVIGDMFVQIPNFLGCLLSSLQLTLFRFYSNGKKIGDSDVII